MPALSILRAFRRIVRRARSVEDEASCLALPVIVQKLRLTKPCSILELGSAYGANIDFYSTLSAKICVEDLPSQIQVVDSDLSNQKIMIDLEKALQSQSGAQFDLIMAWDILNCFSTSELQLLIQKLSKVSKPGTLLYCRMAVKKSHPAVPVVHKIKNANKIICQKDNSLSVSSPRYNKGQLKTLLAPFRRHRSFLMQSGYEEYIFEFQDQNAAQSQPSTTRRKSYY